MVLKYNYALLMSEFTSAPLVIGKCKRTLKGIGAVK